MHTFKIAFLQNLLTCSQKCFNLKVQGPRAMLHPHSGGGRGGGGRLSREGQEGGGANHQGGRGVRQPKTVILIPRASRSY